MLKNISKASLFLLVLFNLNCTVNAQVGINTNTPSTTLDIGSVPGNTSLADGVMPPSITGDQLQAKTYTADLEGTIVYVSAAATAPAGQAINVTNKGFYVFNGSTWDKLVTEVSGIFIPVVIGSGNSTPGFLFDPLETTNTYTFGAGSLTTLNGEGLNSDTTFTAPTNGTYSFELSFSFYDIELTAFTIFYADANCLDPCSPEGLIRSISTSGPPPRDNFVQQIRLITSVSFSTTMNAGQTVGPLVWNTLTDPTFRTTSAMSDLKMVVSRVAP